MWYFGTSVMFCMNGIHIFPPASVFTFAVAHLGQWMMTYYRCGCSCRSSAWCLMLHRVIHSPIMDIGILLITTEYYLTESVSFYVSLFAPLRCSRCIPKNWLTEGNYMYSANIKTVFHDGRRQLHCCIKK